MQRSLHSPVPTLFKGKEKKKKKGEEKGGEGEGGKGHGPRVTHTLE